MVFKATHKGWMLFCPIYLNGLDTGEVGICERHVAFVPVLSLCNFLVRAWAAVKFTLTGRDIEGFPLYITGECRRAVQC